MRLYERSDLLAAALRKHGEEGLAKKHEKMKQRIEKKRKAEEMANEYAKLLDSGGSPAALDAAFSSPGTAKKAKTSDAIDLTADRDGMARVLNVGSAAPAPAPPAVDAALVASLRAEARRNLKALCSWDYLRSKNSPNGCGGTVRIERVEQPVFAALIGRVADPEPRAAGGVVLYKCERVDLLRRAACFYQGIGRALQQQCRPRRSRRRGLLRQVQPVAEDCVGQCLHRPHRL